MYLLKFKGGTQVKVSEEIAHKIGELWAKEPESKRVITFKNGTKTQLCNLQEMYPLRSQDDYNAPTPERVMGYLQLAASNKPSEKKSWWVERIRENIESMKKGGKWNYYDQDLVSEAKRLFS